MEEPFSYRNIDKQEILLLFALQKSSEVVFSSWGEYEPQIEQLGKLLYHSNTTISERARSILSKYNSLNARILIQNRYSNNQYRISRSNFDGIEFSKIKDAISIVDVYKQDEKLYSVSIERVILQGRYRYVLHLPQSDWIREYLEIAYIVLDITEDIWWKLQIMEDVEQEEEDFDLLDMFDGDVDAYNAWNDD